MTGPVTARIALVFLVLSMVAALGIMVWIQGWLFVCIAVPCWLLSAIGVAKLLRWRSSG